MKRTNFILNGFLALAIVLVFAQCSDKNNNAATSSAAPAAGVAGGQPASPTRLGKEIMVFVYRLNRQLAVLKACPVTAKFGGSS